MILSWQAGSLTVLTSGIWLLHTTRKQPGAGPSALRVPMRVATVALLGAVAYQVGKSMMSSDTEAKPALLGKEKATIEVIEEPQATPTKP
jgi:hypothetical protein